MRWHRLVMAATFTVTFTVMGAVCGALTVSGAEAAQTQKALTNADIVNMTKQGFEPGLIVKAIESSGADFDVSPQGLMDLKTAGVNQTVMEAMLSAEAKKPSSAVEAVHGGAVVADGATNGGAGDTSKPVCNATIPSTSPLPTQSPSPSGCLLREGTELVLNFASNMTSKTANVGDPVEFLLGDDLKVGETVVVAKGAHAVATVSAAKKAGMVGRPGELSVQMQYLAAGANHIRLRGTKGREGDSRTGATVALTVLFGPIGLIKHGKNVEIAAGTPLTAYVDQDIWLVAGR